MIYLFVTGSRWASVAEAEHLIDSWARSFVDPAQALYTQVMMITGDAHGVDQAARAWAWAHGIGLLVGIAQWKSPQSGAIYTKAGPERNEAMAQIIGPLHRAGERVEALALPGPSASGTWDMRDRLVSWGITPKIKRVSR